MSRIYEELDFEEFTISNKTFHLLRQRAAKRSSFGIGMYLELTHLPFLPSPDPDRTALLMYFKSPDHAPDALDLNNFTVKVI